jgi:UDP-glucose 4-epimerase
MNDTFRGKKILVTGGLGFIGSNLAARLVGEGAEVTVVDSLIAEYGGNRHNVVEIVDHIQIINCDVREQEAMDQLIVDKDIMFNLAGQTSHMDSMTDPYTDLDINAKAQLSMLEACRKYNPFIKVVFASTRQIYGKPRSLPVAECHPLNPVDVNGINKMAGEFYHLLYYNVYGIRATVLRLTNTIGPRMRIKDARQTFLGVWIRLLLEGKPFEVWDGPQLRDFTFVNDAVDAFLFAARKKEADGQVYNLGGPPPLSLKVLADMLVHVHEGGSYEVKTYPKDRKKIDIGDYYADYSKISRDLGWSPKTDLLDALSQTLSYYRDHLPFYK